MASSLYMPPCPTDCSSVVLDTEFSTCAPTYHWGEISYIYIADNEFDRFFDVDLLPEWTTFLADNTIEQLTVIGELPEAETTEIQASGDRIAVGYKTFTLSFEIDETNYANYSFLQSLECGNKFRIWFETSDGVLYGGMYGIEATVYLNLMIPRERTALVKFMGTATWKSQFSPYACDSPVHA